MNFLSCPTGSNYKRGRLRQGYINGCTVLDTRWEQINWLDDITYTYSTRQLDNGEDRLEGKQDSWLGNGQGKLELAGWHHSPSTRTLFKGEWIGWIRGQVIWDIMCTWCKSWAVDCGEACNIRFVLHDILID